MKQRAEVVKICIIVVAALLGLSAWAQPTGSVTLTWDANVEEDLAGYAVLRGESPGVYTFRQDVGLVTSAVVGGLQPGKTYYFSALAINRAGLESDPAKEVTWVTETGTPVLAITGWQVERDSQQISMRWDVPPTEQGVGRWRIRYRVGSAGKIVEVMSQAPRLVIENPGTELYVVLISAEGLQGWGPETRHEVPSLPRVTGLAVRDGKTMWVFGP